MSDPPDPQTPPNPRRVRSMSARPGVLPGTRRRLARPPTPGRPRALRGQRALTVIATAPGPSVGENVANLRRDPAARAPRPAAGDPSSIGGRVEWS